jgi:hypothetical protein
MSIILVLRLLPFIDILLILFDCFFTLPFISGVEINLIF